MVPASRAARTIESTAERLQEDLSRLEWQKRALERELAAVLAHLTSVQRALSALEAVLEEPSDTVRQEPTGAAREEQPGTERAYGRLTEQILHCLAQAGDTDVRARDVAVALGRPTDSGSVNAIRSTLDRLVGASRVRRTGRGLYRAQRP
ncbi:hypothetical protein J7I94_00345 [Streptomyces sp. ISL-12]|uniref:hypothetical protein n=1 Tax=Streptomyces sp. ISL-12 TaxID=2819177 RepID=UPI001BE6D2F2|nr:hypothetical protein [Streptomyces sp. ISL-12]MBT2409020.1 hypothetical protein [Streptomyces sp. ISL-12]